MMMRCVADSTHCEGRPTILSLSSFTEMDRESEISSEKLFEQFLYLRQGHRRLLKVIDRELAKMAACGQRDLFLAAPAEIAALCGATNVEEELAVVHIEYGSPGVQDVAGIGKIVEVMKDFIEWIIEYCSSHKARKLDNEARALKNQELRIQNATRFVELAKQCGYRQADLRQLLPLVLEKQETFEGLAEHGKIVSAEVLPMQQH